jgi:CRISPR/Cas system-associated protein Csx1
MRNIYIRILGEEFMNSPVEGTIEESKFVNKKIKEFKERNKLNK